MDCFAVDNVYPIIDFEIIKFLRSVGTEWSESIMPIFVSEGTLEMIQYTNEDGCPWSSHDFKDYGEYFELMWPTRKS